MIILRCFSIFFLESRALVFVSNVITVFLSLCFLLYSTFQIPLVIIILLVLIFPIMLANAFVGIIFIGKKLNVKPSYTTYYYYN